MLLQQSTPVAERLDFHLPITTEETLRAYVSQALGVKIPDVQVCPNHTTPWRAFVDAYFARAAICVWKASRGFGGKTFLLGTLGLTEAQTLGADVNILGGSGEQSKKVLGYVSDLGAKDTVKHLLSGEVQRETRFINGAKVTALAASQTSVRGPHVPRLRMDEIDEMDLKILDAALGQPMRQGTIRANTVLSSTHQYPDGTMTAILQRAKEKNYPVYEWCWRESSAEGGWLLDEDIAQKRTEVTAEMWKIEYDLQEPSIEDRAIVTEAVEKMFDKALGEFEGAPNEYIEIEGPMPGAYYATGADWARKSNFTTIITARIDIWPHKIVAFKKMNRKAWPLMIREFNERLVRYPGDAAHDATGVGDVVHDYLEAQDARGNIMAGRTRDDMLSRYITAIENGEYIAPRIGCMYAEHLFATNETLYGRLHLPDTISSMANLHSVIGISAEEETYEFSEHRG